MLTVQLVPETMLQPVQPLKSAPSAGVGGERHRLAVRDAALQPSADPALQTMPAPDTLPAPEIVTVSEVGRSAGTSP